MAMFPSHYDHNRDNSRRNLICGVCQDVYRDPRLLPCHHSFCLVCLKDLARHHGRQHFRCPTCRKAVQVPVGGVEQFTHNFWISDEDLERERRGTSIDLGAMCSIHPMEELIYFCKRCDQSICARCKNTKHEGPEHLGTVDLWEEAERCKNELERTRWRVEGSVSRLMKKSAIAQDNLKAARQKTALLKEQVQVQHLSIVNKATKLRDQVLNDLDKLAQAMDKDLTSDAQTVQHHLDTLVQLQQRVSHALNNANDAEVVALEKEMRGEGSAEKLAEMEESTPATTQRPGLLRQTDSLKDDYFRLFLGSPVKVEMPNVGTVDCVTPYFRFGTEDACREIHAVFHNDKQMLCIGIGGEAPDYEDEHVVQLDNSLKVISSKKTDKKISFGRLYSFSLLHQICLGAHRNINAKIYPKSRVSRLRITNRKREIRVENGETKNAFQLTSCPDPCEFDVTADNQTIVIIERKNVKERDAAALEDSSTGSLKQPNGTTPREVKLYYWNQPRPVATYTPPQQPFFPTDVCFWTKEGQTLLLISDSMNDSVHVVRVENDQFHFLRYLGASSGDLIRPTALDVDSKGTVWIGCANGWVLQCEFNPDFRAEEENDGQLLLCVDNASASGRTSDTPSQLSEETS